ncbi:MAG: type 4a pilus biogenesis protein PilO [Planctomycetota bacterium]|nr:type 4a pilus biogenesis protein PilO [Planctomycetota bacterium]
MSKWSQKKQLMGIAISAAFVCSVAAGGVFYVKGLIADVDAQHEVKQGELRVADAKISKIPALEKEVVILRENLGEYVKILPDDDQLNDFVRMVNRFGGQSGVRGTGLQKKDLRQRKKPGRFLPIAYTYEMTATLWQGLNFMNLVENFERFVSITQFSITPGAADNGAATTIDGEVVHTIKVTMQTYQYNSAGSAKDVVIPRYDDRKDELREEIWERIQTIRVDRYEHLGQSGRRDIFVDPRATGAEGSDEASLEEQRKALERGLGWVESLGRIQARLQSDEATMFERFALEKRFKQELAAALDGVEAEGRMIHYQPYRSRWSQEVAVPLAKLRDGVVAAGPDAEIDPYLKADEMEELIALMATDCSDGKLEEARKRYEGIAERLAVPESDDRYDLAVSAKRWHLKAVTAMDFQALDLQVQGVVVNGGGGRSGVLLNGDVYEEGDYVQDDLLIKQVDAEQVWFVFRGLTLVRSM